MTMDLPPSAGCSATVRGGGADRSPVGHFHLASEWHLGAGVPAVWDLLAETRHWPRWWPHVRSVERTHPGGDDGVGAVHRIRWRSALAYGFDLEITTCVAERPGRIVGTSAGDLTGVGRWELAAIPVGTRVRYLWDVALTRTWMRVASPVLHPVFRWNHHRVMQAGAAGMAHALAVELIDYRALPED